MVLGQEIEVVGLWEDWEPVGRSALETIGNTFDGTRAGSAQRTIICMIAHRSTVYCTGRKSIAINHNVDSEIRCGYEGREQTKRRT